MVEILNYSTSIAVSKSAGEVIGLLSRGGVKSIGQELDSSGNPVGVNFSMLTEYGVRYFELPVKVEGVLAALKQDKRTTSTQRTPEHAAKVAWRIAKDWLEAQIALIDSGLATLDEVLLPYMIGNKAGQTMYQLYLNEQKAIEK